MATIPHALVTAVVNTTGFPRIRPEAVRPLKYAALAGGPTLLVGTALAVNSATSLWVPWMDGGANDTGTVRGFVYPNKVILSATGERIDHVLLGGRIHVDDMIDYTTGTSSAGLKVAVVASGLRALGIIVEGLPGVK